MIFEFKTGIHESRFDSTEAKNEIAGAWRNPFS